MLEAGTITCRYHGMTFDGDGECVAFLADGPDSPACGRTRTRAYPTEEAGGVVWVWMGDLFSGQRPSGRLTVEELDGRGLHVEYRDRTPQAGQFSIDQIEWYLPNLVYHDHDDLGGGLGAGFFWFVPRDVGSFTGFFILGLKDAGHPVLNALKRAMFQVMWSPWYPVPGSVSSCLDGGDLPMMASQGRVARWDADDLARPDAGVVKARRMVMAAHAEEQAARRHRAAAAGVELPRIRRPDVA